MTTPTPSSKSPNDGSQKNNLGDIEFELTDFDTARHALDDLPAGVAEVHRLTPGYWEERRRASQPTDRALLGSALEWIVRLPPTLRPRRLAERYPRVLNSIAETWTSPDKWEQTFDDLLSDQRGGRKGFPYEIEVELKALRRYREGLQVK